MFYWKINPLSENKKTIVTLLFNCRTLAQQWDTLHCDPRKGAKRYSLIKTFFFENLRFTFQAGSICSNFSSNKLSKIKHSIEFSFYFSKHFVIW